MLHNLEFLEFADLVPAVIPVDADDGDNTGDRVNMEHYEHLVFVLLDGIDAGGGGGDPVITARQHDAATSGNSKDLATIDKVWYKVGSTAVSAVGQWSTATQTAAASYDSAAIDGSENEMILVAQIRARALDQANGYKYASFNISGADSGNAQLLAALYILYPARYEQATLPDPTT